MRLLTARHAGLKRYLEGDDQRALPANHMNKLRRMLTALRTAPDMKGLQAPPGWRPHQLTGDRAGTWSLTLSGN